MDWEGTKYTARTDTDGFFLFEWKDKPPLPHGWHEITVNLIQEGSVVSAAGKGSIYVPCQTQYGFISDIDDTCLISYSANFRKRLFVLFTQNERSRYPFEYEVK